jgi:predicted dehydrogenase
MPKIKALVLGCGNIGAGYDLQNSQTIHTHVKAFSLHKNIALTVADVDSKKAEAVAKRFRATAIDLNKINFSEYAIISIATPTSTHADYLSRLLELNTPVILCEKPVAQDLAELANLKRKYSKSKSKILVNYMRRFTPGFSILKRRVQKIHKKENLLQITIKYNRGLLNNGTHAIDLVEFLFDEAFKFKKFVQNSVTPGAFAGDPTVSGRCRFGSATVLFCGVQDAVFEVELLFTNSKILVGDRGNSVRYFQSKKKNTFVENLRLQQRNLLTTYMKPVVAKALRLKKNGKEEDNFMQALVLNERTLRLIIKITE